MNKNLIFVLLDFKGNLLNHVNHEKNIIVTTMSHLETSLDLENVNVMGRITERDLVIVIHHEIKQHIIIFHR